jgi:hypothetical protein
LGLTTSSFGPAPIVPTSSKLLPPSRLRLTLPSLPALKSASGAPQAMRAPNVVSRWRQVRPSLFESQVPWSVETAQLAGLAGLTATSIGAAADGASRVVHVLPPAAY